MDSNERNEYLNDGLINGIKNRQHNEKDVFTFDQNDVVSLSKTVPPGN